MSVATAPDSPAAFEWRRWPETESVVNELVEQALAGNAFAARLAERMTPETGTIIQNWLDHLVVGAPPSFGSRLVGLGFERQAATYAVGTSLYAHPGGIFPRIAHVPAVGGVTAVKDLAIKVDSAAAFSGAHNLGLKLQGYPLGPYRFARVAGDATDLVVVERRGYLGYRGVPQRAGPAGPDEAPGGARRAGGPRSLAGSQTAVRRRRRGLRRDRGPG